MNYFGVPIYLQIAEDLRERIDQGVYATGKELPAEHALAREFNCGRDTVRATLDILCDEGLISKRRGKRAIVRPQPERRTLVLQSDEQLLCRMPSYLERAQLGLDPGVPVLEVRLANGSNRLYAASRITVVSAAWRLLQQSPI